MMNVQSQCCQIFIFLIKRVDVYNCVRVLATPQGARLGTFEKNKSYVQLKKTKKWEKAMYTL